MNPTRKHWLQGLTALMLAVPAFAAEETAADPDEISFMLGLHGNAGTDACMDKDAIAALVPSGTSVQKGAVGLGHRLDGLLMDRGQRAVSGVPYAIRGKGCRPSDPRMQP